MPQTDLDQTAVKVFGKKKNDKKKKLFAQYIQAKLNKELNWMKR